MEGLARYRQITSEQNAHSGRGEFDATNVLEHPELIADRIVQYANIVGRENVIAGTDCGLGGRIDPQLAWEKLRALREGADLASKQLWK